MNARTHSDLMACRDAIHTALGAEMAKRRFDPTFTWIDRERQAISDAATAWAGAHGIDQVVTAEDVERIEVRAVGHFDYQAKLALYVAELVVCQ